MESSVIRVAYLVTERMCSLERGGAAVCFFY